MAAFTAAASSMRLGSSFTIGSTPLRCAPTTSTSSFAAPPQRLQVTASKKLMGKVVTDTNDKSVTVEVVRIAVYPKYKKRVKTTKNYVVHDPENSAKKGDMVVLAKCVPVSKRKHFAVVSVKSGRIEKDPEMENEVKLPFFESEEAEEEAVAVAA
jgi:small subunit ribosomal protein S17